MEEKQGKARCPASETTGPRAEKKMVSQALEVSMCADWSDQEVSKPQ